MKIWADSMKIWADSMKIWADSMKAFQRAVVMAQLVERALPTLRNPQFDSSHGQFY